ncbi:MAG: response regulator [Elusimicrobiota bacterium]
MIKILVVDDQFSDRELAKDILEDHGFSVEAASNGGEALEKLNNEQFDIVLTDFMMPGMDGLELVQRIKEKKYDTEIIVMTAYATVKTAIQTIKLGAYDYLIKPLDRHKISVVVNNCISAHRLSKEIKMLHQKMFNIEKMSTISQLTASIAHQIRNPLFAIQSTAEYLSEKYSSDKTLQESLDRIVNDSQKADEIIHSLLRTTKSNEIKIEKTSVVDIINQTIELVRPEIDRKNINIVTEFSNKICVLANGPYLQQCLINIIMNSLEAFEMSQENKIIKIKVFVSKLPTEQKKMTDESANKFGCIEIEDNGKGIPQEMVSKVFEPFFTSKSSGTGIGLFFVHQIITNYFDGNMKLESIVGKGTKVTISLLLTTC